MNVFAGNILIPGNTVVELDEFDYIENFSQSGEKVLYIFGETDISKPEELRQYFENVFGIISYYDMSISTQDAVGITPYDYESGIYECSSFEGEAVEFEEIADRFEDVEGVFSIREAEISKLFGNRVVRVDFIY